MTPHGTVLKARPSDVSNVGGCQSKSLTFTPSCQPKPKFLELTQKLKLFGDKFRIMFKK
jgi:hypothetical protein